VSRHRSQHNDILPQGGIVVKKGGGFHSLMLERKGNPLTRAFSVGKRRGTVY